VDKPVVHYTEVTFMADTAVVKCVDHPHLKFQEDGSQHGFTSRVIRRQESGEFETENTIYRKVG
jgi:hypothetical protein